MKIDLALSWAINILNGIINLTNQLQQVSNMIQQARLEGRDLTDEELAKLAEARLTARQQALDA